VSSGPQEFNPAPEISGAFGFSVSSPNEDLINSQLGLSNDIAALLKQRIVEHIYQQWAMSAATTDQLNNSIRQKITNDLLDGQGNLINLQSPIAAKVIGQMGATLENVIPLGVKPPTQSGDCPTPDCVVFCEQAKTGRAAAAQQYYVDVVLQNRHVNPILYANGVSFLQDCLQNYSAVQIALLSWIAEQEKRQDAGEKISSAIRAGASEATPSSTPAVGPSAEVGSGVATNINIKSAAIATNLLSALQSHLAAQSGAGPNPPGGYPRCNPGINTNGEPELCSMSLDDARKLAGPNGITSICLNDQGEWYTWTLNVLPDGDVQFCQAIGAMAPSCELWSGCNPAHSGPPAYPLPPPQIPVPPPTPSCPPPPPSCPAPVVNVTCPTPEKPPEKPPKPPEPQPKPCYTMYCTSEGLVYVIKCEDPPHSSGDQVVATGDPKEWDQIDICRKCGGKQIDLIPPIEPPPAGLPDFNIQAGCDDLFRFPGVMGDYDPDFFVKLLVSKLGYIGGEEAANLSLVDKIINEGKLVLGTIVGSAPDLLADWCQAVVNKLTGGQAEDTGIILARTILGATTKWVSNAAEGLEASAAYAYNFRNSWKLPSSDEALNSYLANNIDEDRLRCIAKANGYIWDDWKAYADSQRSKFPILQLATMLRREYIDPQLYGRAVRELGYIRDRDADLAYRLTEQIPPPSDIVRMMVRDSADEALVAKFQLDDLFANKFNGQLADWAKHQGIDTTYMKFLWRAHWSIPAPGQLATMLHRLSRLPQNDPAFVDMDTVKTALVQQDIAPFWQDKFIAISYNPLTRIDARRAFEIGALSEDDLKEAYLNLGYNSDNADVLVQFNKRNVNRTFMRRSEVKWLADGQISNGEFETAMKKWGASDEAIEDARMYADILASRGRRKNCIKLVEKRVKSGEINAKEAYLQLVNLGSDESVSAELVEGWQCEIKHTGKELSVAQISSLLDDGILSPQDFINRAKNLGYDHTDAALLFQRLQRRIQLRMTRAEQMQLREQERQSERDAKAQARDAKLAGQGIRRAQASAARLIKLNETRERRILEAAKNFSSYSGEDIADAIIFVKGLYRYWINNTVLTIDQVIVALISVTADKNVKTRELLTSGLVEAFRDLQAPILAPYT
jgi:hypothetical protein